MPPNYTKVILPRPPGPPQARPRLRGGPVSPGVQRWSNCTPPSSPSDAPGAGGETTPGTDRTPPPVAPRRWKVQRQVGGSDNGGCDTQDGGLMLAKVVEEENKCIQWVQPYSPVLHKPDMKTLVLDEDLGSPLYEEVLPAKVIEITVPRGMYRNLSCAALPTQPPPLPPPRSITSSLTCLHDKEPQDIIMADPDFLMSWWQKVSSWDDLENHPKGKKSEEAKVITVKARRIQNALQLYDLLLSRYGETLKNHITELHCISDNLDKVSKGTKIAGMTGGAAGALGGVAAVAGVVLSPFTMGASLALTAIGVGVATAGGVTGASAAIAHKVSVTQDRKKIEKILQDYMSQVQDIEACLKFINRGMESLRKHNLATLTGVNIQAVRVAKVAEVAGGSARAIEASSKASGMLSGFALGMDIYFSGSGGQKLKKGLESKFGKKIRQVAQQLGDGLDELMKVKDLFEKSLEEV